MDIASIDWFFNDLDLIFDTILVYFFETFFFYLTLAPHDKLAGLPE